MAAETVIGKAYQVQVADSLVASAWSNLGFVLPANSMNTMVDLPMTGREAYYRIVEAD